MIFTSRSESNAMYKLQLKKFLCLILITFSAIGCSQAPIPVTSQDVQAYLMNAKSNIQTTVEKIGGQKIEEASFETTIEPLNQLASDMLENMAILTFISWTDLPSKQRATDSINELQAFYAETFFKNTGVYNSIINYIVKTSSNGTRLSPYQRYELQTLLDSCDNLNAYLPKEHQALITQLKNFNKSQGFSPFNYVKGLAPEKAVSRNGFTILNLNTCCLPGNQTLFFGGVFPWKQRISSVAEKILKTNADVVCLQEVFVEEAGYALYEKLKMNYAHFYMGIGPRVAGFSFETLGFPSGLFVASKYPIVNPNFSSFTATALQMNYGFFDFTIPSVAHIYTTHLVPMHQLAPVRSLQMSQILEKMKIDLQEAENIPFFLCGDLNVPLKSGEQSEAIIQAYFDDAYNEGITKITAENETCTSYFTNYFLASDKNPEKITPNFEILDYALVLKQSNAKITTKRISMNDGVHPETAVSDHHGLLTTFQ